MNSNPYQDAKMKRPYIMLIALLLLINGVTLYLFSTHKPTPKSEVRKCIEQSEYTDSDICDCLHKYGETDSKLCGDE